MKMRTFFAAFVVSITAFGLPIGPAQADQLQISRSEPDQAEQIKKAKSELAQLTNWRKGKAAGSEAEKKLVADIQRWAAAVSKPSTGEAQLKRISRRTTPSDIENRIFGIVPKRDMSCSSDCYIELARNDEASCGPWDWLPVSGCHTFPNLVFAACLGDCIFD